MEGNHGRIRCARQLANDMVASYENEPLLGVHASQLVRSIPCALDTDAQGPVKSHIGFRALARRDSAHVDKLEGRLCSGEQLLIKFLI